MKDSIQKLKHVVFYNTIGIIVFSCAFLANKYLDFSIYETQIDLRYFGVVFLVSMMAYTIPTLKEIK